MLLSNRERSFDESRCTMDERGASFQTPNTPQTIMSNSNSTPTSPSGQTRETQLQAEEFKLLDERLDEELEQSFPASDPLPWHHDLDPSVHEANPVDRQQRENAHERTPKI
jgi:hypothetical protein